MQKYYSYGMGVIRVWFIEKETPKTLFLKQKDGKSFSTFRLRKADLNPKSYQSWTRFFTDNLEYVIEIALADLEEDKVKLARKTERIANSIASVRCDNG